MNTYLFLIFIGLTTPSLTIFDFKKTNKLSDWIVVNDGVMGGLSKGEITLNDKGNAIFSGAISLENNGGFSMVRYRFSTKKVKGYTKALITLKGDQKRYQFRVKTNTYDRHSYIAHFETSGEWQTIEIPLSEMYPVFRGVSLDMQNYPSIQMEEIAFLIGNKKQEKFRLEIDKIVLE
ncbi:CIA30 family protein [uncultured Aquimarina sp.]|uniref:CIA30 family protein n=1 Tax=uncultured Aquimarina sp. TaxID=575652 RepID=UPI002639EC02|nr:CIA30 family protein [uncultured Aquimarina sp.]